MFYGTGRNLRGYLDARRWPLRSDAHGSAVVSPLVGGPNRVRTEEAAKMEQPKPPDRLTPSEQSTGVPNRTVREVPQLVWSCACGQVAPYFRKKEVQRIICVGCGAQMRLRLRSDL